MLRLYQPSDDHRPSRAVPRLTVPAGPQDLPNHFDLTVSRPAIDNVTFASFDVWLAEAAAAHGLSCGLIHEGVAAAAIRRLNEGSLTIGYHLDYYALWHVADDPFANLAVAVRDSGGRTVNSPERARLFTDKAAAHCELARAGLPVPPTLLVRPHAGEWKPSPQDRARLRLDEPGARVYVKPANGFGGNGVVRIEPPQLAEAVAEARRGRPRETFLIQREVRCPRLPCDDGVERPAYWRVLHCLGEVLPFWWQPGEHASPDNPSYRLMTAAEVEQLGLRPVLDYAGEIARLSGLDWFSTELCLGASSGPARHRVRAAGRDWAVLAIDYVNDQCAVDVQSRWPGAAPDEVVRHVGWRFAAFAAWLRPAARLAA